MNLRSLPTGSDPHELGADSRLGTPEFAGSVRGGPLSRGLRANCLVSGRSFNGQCERIRHVVRSAVSGEVPFARSQTDKRGFRSKREAELFIASVEVSQARGDFVSAARLRITVGEWAVQWLATQVQPKPSTRNGYESIVRSAIVPKWGETQLAGLTHAGIQKWLAEVSTRAAPSTTRSYHRVLSIMLKYAIRDGRLTRNPADGVKLPRVVSRKHGYLAHAQVHQFAELCGPDGDVIMFLSYTGLRWGEMAALRVMDLDMLRPRVNVDQAVTEVGYKLVYGTPKNHSRRSVPFPSFLSEMLAARCEGKKPSEFVFTSPEGGPIRDKK